MAKEYLDFVLRIDERSGNAYPVSVLSSPAGEASTRMSLDVSSPALQERLAVTSARGGKTRSAAGETYQTDPYCISSTEGLGRDLFASLFSGNIRTQFETSLQMAQGEGKGLRIRLRIQDPGLAAIPWEFLIRDNSGPLVIDSNTPLVRHVEIDRAVRPLEVPPPIRVLGMIGASTGLDVDREMKQMESAIEHLLANGTVQLTWVEGHTWRALQSALNREAWHVFHFIGHGTFDGDTGKGQILLEAEDKSSGAEYRLAAEDLARMLRALPSLRLTLLNSCEGARSSENNLFSSVGARLAADGIPAVISMQYEISDRAALEFSRRFYEALAEGMPVDAAASQARQSIKMTLVETIEWGTPVLHMRSPDGMLFQLSFASALFQPKASQAAAPPPIPKPAVAAPPSSPAIPAAGPAKLANKVRSIWVDSVLKQKVNQSARLQVGLQRMEGDQLQCPGGAGYLVTADGTHPLEQQSPAQLLMEEFGNMLILGDPGSGKTVALLEVARDLLDALNDDASRAVPVVFNLSSWAAKKLPLGEWMAMEMVGKYGVDRRIGQQWIADGSLIPLLDGLDEVAAGARPACVDAINQALDQSLTGVVVCCRFKEYQELPGKLSLNGAIRMEPLSRDQVFGFLDQFGAPMAGLKTLLERDSGLLIDARTPLMLTLMTRAFQGMTIDPATLSTDQGLAERRKMVMKQFVDREFERQAKGGSRI